METLWQSWEQTVARSGIRNVLLDADGHWMTASALHQQALTLAAAFESQHRLAGQICAYCLPNGAEWLCVFLALQKCGAIALALDPTLPEGLQQDEARRVGAACFYSDGELIRLGEGACYRAPLCLAKLTSGSTGRPQALLFKHSEMLADGRQIIRSMGICDTDLNYGLIPFGHSYGLGNLVMPLIIQGTGIVVAKDSFPRDVARHIAEAGATVLPSVPAFYNALVQADVDPSALNSLRLAISAGSMLGRETAAAYRERFGRCIHNFYGSSETGGIAFDRTGQATLTGESVGTPLDEVDVTVTRDGRFQVTSAAVTTYGRRTSDHGSWKLEDKGQITAAGEIRILGRRRPLAKIGGRRVDPLEVEGAIRQVQGVKEVVVRVVSGSGGDRLSALVESDLPAREVRTRLGLILAPWKVPRHIVVVEELPRNARGKVDHESVRTLLGLP